MKIFVTLFAIVFSMSAHAQNTSTIDMPAVQQDYASTSPQLWFNIGPNFSGVSTRDSTGTGIRTALSVGAEIEFPINEMFSLQTGLDYIQKGVNLDDTATTSNGSISLNYLVIPALAKFNLPINQNHLTLYAGPYAALAVDRGMDLVSTQAGNLSGDLSDTVGSFDFGARFGAGFEMPIQASLTVAFNINYDLGFTNIANSDLSSDSLSNRNFMTTVGLGLKL